MTLFLSSSAGSVSIFNKPCAGMSTNDLSIMPTAKFNYDGVSMVALGPAQAPMPSLLPHIGQLPYNEDKQNKRKSHQLSVEIVEKSNFTGNCSLLRCHTSDGHLLHVPGLMFSKTKAINFLTFKNNTSLHQATRISQSRFSTHT